MRLILKYARDELAKAKPEMGRFVVGSFLFLRFICPALVSPGKYGLLSEKDKEKELAPEAIRALLLVAKLLQNLANNVEFDGSKEEYMTKMNDFITKNMDAVNKFFETLTVEEGSSKKHKDKEEKPTDAAFQEIVGGFLLLLKTAFPPPMLNIISLMDRVDKSPSGNASLSDSTSTLNVNDVVTFRSSVDTIEDDTTTKTNELSSSRESPQSDVNLDTKSLSQSTDQLPSIENSQPVESDAPSAPSVSEPTTNVPESTTEAVSETSNIETNAEPTTTTETSATSEISKTPDASETSETPEKLEAPEASESTKDASESKDASEPTKDASESPTDTTEATKDSTETPNDGPNTQPDETTPVEPIEMVESETVTEDREQIVKGEASEVEIREAAVPSEPAASPSASPAQKSLIASSTSIETLSEMLTKEEPEDKVLKDEPIQPQTTASESTEAAEAPNVDQLKDSEKSEQQKSEPQPKRLVKQLSFKGVDTLERPSPRERISFNLAADLSEKEETKKPDPGTTSLTQSQMSFFNAKNVAQFKDNWTSKVSKGQEWPEQYILELPEGHIPLVDPACTKKGEYIESGGRKVLYDPTDLIIEDRDNDVRYYNDFLADKAHFNFVGDDDSSGPIIISIEKGEKHSAKKLKALIRTKEKDDRLMMPAPRKSGSTFGEKMKMGRKVDLHLKALLETKPNLASLNLRRVDEPELTKELVTFEKQMVDRAYKIGILYCKDGQVQDENGIFSNTETSADYEEFLDWIGKKIELKGWDKFRGGLDVKNGSTGTHSVYTTFESFEIMFHVGTLLPFNQADIQQLERKRHIGNDIVVVIFSESTSAPFDPAVLVSHFNHVFIVVQKIQLESDKEGLKKQLATMFPGADPASLNLPTPHPPSNNSTYYRIQVVCRPGVRSFSPFLPFPAIFPKNHETRDFLLAKIINAERAAMYARDFVNKIARTRQTLLRAIITHLNEKKDKK
eukprot:TRINITY_DN8023_c0_g1_i3.p1 TRINITY_DN8023_c0_g1~~TRINITY_DN8023_c0_g1_i3.p1  ORF type:complete len:968 (+),score=239.81 TRINITY_DN8023_c0_g1_i3:2187-5090(+)